MLDCQLFGLNSGAQHGVNVLLHAANVLLLFWILQKATGALWRSSFVALLFAVHPLNVETVAWIAQRKSLLSAFFSLLTVAAYGWYVHRGGWNRYLLLVFLFALSLMAKPMAVSLPLLLLLFDYWPLRRCEELAATRRWAKLTLEKLPLFAISAASSVLTQMAQGAGGSVMGLSLLPASARIENAAISYVAYIGKLLWSARLATYYPLQLSPALGDAVASAAILIAISALALYLRRFPYLAVGWFFFLISMVPVIGIVQVGFQGMADRYTYIPAIGLMIAIVWTLADAVQAIPVARVSLSLAAFCVVVAFSVATVRYLPAWQDSVTLFAHARSVWGQPDMWLEQLYGNALFSAGRIDEALDHYQQSCAIQPRTEYCHYNIAHIFLGRGQFGDAIREYDLALRYTASRDMALLCLTETA
jgi:tetratricopeptide (TPR) repeat protein